MTHNGMSHAENIIYPYNRVCRVSIFCSRAVFDKFYKVGYELILNQVLYLSATHLY
jgi:hypothetical protein